MDDLTGEYNPYIYVFKLLNLSLYGLMVSCYAYKRPSTTKRFYFNGLKNI